MSDEWEWINEELHTRSVRECFIVVVMLHGLNATLSGTNKSWTSGMVKPLRLDTSLEAVDEQDFLSFLFCSKRSKTPSGFFIRFGSMLMEYSFDSCVDCSCPWQSPWSEWWQCACSFKRTQTILAKLKYSCRLNEYHYQCHFITLWKDLLASEHNSYGANLCTRHIVYILYICKLIYKFRMDNIREAW